MATHKKPSLAVELQPDGRPARELPDPRKAGTRLSQRLLPQLPHEAPSSKTRVRHTAVPRRGSR
jgi:hypothetical protein